MNLEKLEMKTIYRIIIILLVLTAVAGILDKAKVWNTSSSSAAPVPVISFSSTTNYSIGINPTSIFTNLDIEADNDIDLVVANGSTNSINIWYNDGSANFTVNPEFTDFPVGTNPVSIAAGNFNPGTDNIVDVVTANNGSDNITVLLGDNLVVFNSASYAVGTAPTSVALKDLNFDDNLDIIVANGGSDDVSVLLGDGAGVFSTATNFAVGDNPSSVAVEDMNGDSIYDLVVANKDSNDVSILLGDGSGSFGPASAYGVGTSPSWIAIGNLNSNLDSCFDLVTSNEGSDSVSVLFGDCGGGISSDVNFFAGTGPKSVVATDFNSSTDGFSDLAVANGDGTVSILAGDGEGSFALASTLTAGTNPTSIAFGDFTGDNNYDLAVTNGGSNNVSVFINTPVCPSVTFQAVGFSVNEDFPDAYEGRYYSQQVLASGFRGSQSFSISAGSTGAYSFDDLSSAGKVYGTSPAASDSFTIRLTDQWNCFADHAYSFDTLVPPPITGINVTPATFSLSVGRNTPLNAVPSPDNAEDFSDLLTDPIIWDSSDDAIATVDVNGVVTGIAPGVATITATKSQCNPGCFDVTGSSAVTILPLLESIEIIPDNPTIYTTEPDHTVDLTASQVPSDNAIEQVVAEITDTPNPSSSIYSQNVQGTDSLWFLISIVGIGTIWENNGAPRSTQPDGDQLAPRLLFTDSAETIINKLNNALKPEYKDKFRFGVRADLLPDVIMPIIYFNTSVDDSGNSLVRKANSWSTSDAGISTVDPTLDNQAQAVGISAGTIDATAETGGYTFQILVYNDFEQRLSSSNQGAFGKDEPVYRNCIDNLPPDDPCRTDPAVIGHDPYDDTTPVNVLVHETPSGGGGGGYIPPVRPITPVAPSGPIACPVYLTEYIWPYKANNPAAVTLLKNFLEKYEGETGLSSVAIYDQATIEAVKRFQAKYPVAILSEPWNLGGPTGNVYISTLFAINRIVCGLEPIPPFIGGDVSNTAPLEQAIGEILGSQIFIPTVEVPIVNPPHQPATESVKKPSEFKATIMKFIQALSDLVIRFLSIFR